jgi:hypothetical protein
MCVICFLIAEALSQYTSTIIAILRNKKFERLAKTEAMLGNVIKLFPWQHIRAR